MYAAAFAQALPLDPTAGWSAFGLAGLILAWLCFKHLPAKDAQLDRRDAGKDAHVQTLVKEFTETNRVNTGAAMTMLEKQLACFSAEQKCEREHCLKLHSDNMAEHRATHAELTVTRHEMRNLINQVILKKEVEEALKKKSADEKTAGS